MSDVLETFSSMMGNAYEAAADAVALAYDGGKQEERKNIVAWLRSNAMGHRWRELADALDKGDHLK